MLFKILNKLFPDRCREIPGVNGKTLLQQVRVGKRFYLHRFLQPEPKDIFHIHRWMKMRSFVLWGNYVEERMYADRTTSKIKHRMWSTFSMDKSVVHRIDEWNNAWTLFYFSGNNSSWGYLDKDFNFTPWDEYIPEERRVKHV